MIGSHVRAASFPEIHSPLPYGRSSTMTAFNSSLQPVGWDAGLLTTSPTANRRRSLILIVTRTAGAIFGAYRSRRCTGPTLPFPGRWSFLLEKGHRFNSEARLIDPAPAAGRRFSSVGRWDCSAAYAWSSTTIRLEGDRHLPRVVGDGDHDARGFTKSHSSGAKYPLYLGVIEKIPLPAVVGVTAVELMPVHEFPICDIWGNKPERLNYSGYDPMGSIPAASRLRGGHGAKLPGPRVQRDGDGPAPCGDR